MDYLIANPDFNDYVKGKKFDSNFPFKFNFNLKVKNRDEELSKLVKNKKIIHVGCVDHLEIIDSKISNGTWLHRILMDSASRCLGIDINQKGINYIREKYNISDLVSGDLVNDHIPEIENEKWDYILLPEVIEHVPNIIEFLATIKFKYSKNVDKIVISVPNLFSYSLFEEASMNIERINTDHRYWFSPYTLIKILNDANFITEEVSLINGFWGPFYCNIRERLINRFLQLIGKKREYKKIKDMRYAKGLLVIAR